MRIALFFTGRLCVDEEQRANFAKHFLEGHAHTIDIFVSHCKGCSHKVINTFKDMYNPVEMRESDERHFACDHYEKGPTARPHNVLCMHVNRKHAYRMMAQSSRGPYDLMVSSRTDLRFEGKIDWDSFARHARDGFLCIPSPERDYGGINDQFAIGNGNAMETYMNLYDCAYDLLERQKVLLHPETMLAAHLRNKQVSIHRFRLAYYIIRPDGTRK